MYRSVRCASSLVFALSPAHLGDFKDIDFEGIDIVDLQKYVD